MGWGPMLLMTDGGQKPEEVLADFNWTEDPVRIEVSKADIVVAGYKSYSIKANCELRMYCSWCGERMCPGCGDEPTLIAISQGVAAECRDHRGETLRQLDG